MEDVSIGGWAGSVGDRLPGNVRSRRLLRRVSEPECTLVIRAGEGADMDVVAITKQGLDLVRSHSVPALAYPYVCAAAGVLSVGSILSGWRPLALVGTLVGALGVHAPWLQAGASWSARHGHVLDLAWIVVVGSVWIMTLFRVRANARVYSTFWLALAVALQREGPAIPSLTLALGVLIPVTISVIRRRVRSPGEWVMGLLAVLLTALVPLFWIFDPGQSEKRAPS